MAPNEWGDTSAGFAAGLAFFWLVLGFFQQGRELRNQIAELRHTVEAGQAQARSQELSAATSHAQAILEVQREAALQNMNTGYDLLVVLNSLSSFSAANGRTVKLAPNFSPTYMKQIAESDTGFDIYQRLLEKLSAFSDSGNLQDLWVYFSEQKVVYGKFQNAARRFSDGVEIWKKRLEELRAPEWEMRECDNSLEVIVWLELQELQALADKAMLEA